MRKLAAIVLLLIFWFNLFGYQWALHMLEQKADNRLELQIDNKDYNEAELLEIRVSLNMPYQERFTEFERHYGEITIEGKTYQYVKRKIEGDVLVLKCIPHATKDQLKDVASDISRSNSNTDNTPVKSSFKLFSFECDEAPGLPATEIVPVTSLSFFAYADRIPASFRNTPYQPPKA